MSLKTKFSLAASLLVVIVITGVSLFLMVAEKRHLLRKAQEDQENSVKKLASICQESAYAHNDLIVVNYMKTLQRSRGVVSAAFLDQENRALAHSDYSQLGKILNDPVSQQARKSNALLRQEVTSPSGFEDIDLAFPVLAAGQRVGTARLVYSKAMMIQEVRQSLEETGRRLVMVAGVALAIGVFGALLLASTLNRPIQVLAQGARILGEGNLDYQISVRGKDELAQLSQEFNRMATQLKQLDAMKEDFISSVSHELRSPLAAIKGYVDLLLKGKAGPISPTQQEYLTIARESSERLARFINNILDLAKLEAGRMEFAKEPVAVAVLANDIARLFKPSADENQLTIQLDLPNPALEIQADPDRIRQVLTNLIANAIKFTPDGGTITVWARENGTEVKIGVKDTGVGIPQDSLHKVFNKFEQVQETKHRVRKTTGTGLGLSIAKQIVEAHGGRIWVESQLNQGTNFIFTFPLH
ncbi:MAG: HAMP domain-containing histidine kinase [Elusimicrobia bacterium]|nr:HAMP domain-containing histidine kinase [Elusimicrobiota bacterium]